MFIAATIIHFKDGGESEITVLQEGTKEQCDFVCANTHALAYSGSRPFDSAQAFVMEINANAARDQVQAQTEPGAREQESGSPKK